MRPIALLFACVALPLATAQAPATPNDLAALASRVETAHRPSGPVPPVTALRAVLELRLEDRNAEDRGQVDLALRFLQWTRAAGKKPVPLLHYEVLDAGSAVVRGMDPNGPWQLDREEPKSLIGADAAQDLAAFERHQNLVKQLLRFLSPGDVLRGLQKPGPVAEEVLDLKVKKVPCETVAGELAAFPLLQAGGEDAPVAIKIWVGKADGRLVAVDAAPLRDGVPDDGKGERILPGRYEVRDGLLVPFQLSHLYRHPDGKLTLQSTVLIKDLSLRPELRAEDFDRVKVAREAQQRRRK